MPNFFLKNLSILKKFLFINLIIFVVLGTFTIIYLKTVQPNLIKKKAANHIQIIENTIDIYNEERKRNIIIDVRMFDMLGREFRDYNSIPIGTIYIQNRKKLINHRTIR